MSLPKFQILLNDVTIDDFSLGKGSYGLVLSAEWKGVNVAAKRLHDILISDTGSGINAIEGAFIEEADRMTKLRHPNIVQCFGIYNDGRVYIILERMHCSLYQKLIKKRCQTIIEVSHFAHSIASALRYLHEQRPPIAHRDITPKNILFNSCGDAKLSDLGVAKQVVQMASSSPIKATKGPGNPKYMPPEVEGDVNKWYARYDPVKVDAFSLGVVMLEAYSGMEIAPSKQFLPSKECPGRFDRVSEVQRRINCFETIPWDGDLTKLIHQCLKDDAKQRPSALKIQTELKGILLRNQEYYYTACSNYSLDEDEYCYSDSTTAEELYVPTTVQDNEETKAYQLRRNAMDVESKIKRSLTSSKSVSNLDKYEKLDGNQRASQYHNLQNPNDSGYVGFIGPSGTKSFKRKSPVCQDDPPRPRVASNPENPGPPPLPMRTQTNQDNPKKPVASQDPEESIYEDIDEPKIQSSILDVLKVTKRLKRTAAGYLPCNANEVVVTENKFAAPDIQVRNTKGEGGYVSDKYLEPVRPINIVYKPQNKRGITHHILTNGGKQKFHDGIKSNKILITSSPLERGNVQSLLDIKNQEAISTKDSQDASFTIDLGEQRLVRLTKYLLECYAFGSYGFPKSWKLEISIDKRDWKLVGKEERKSLPNMAVISNIQNQTLGRYVKLTQVGQNSANNSKFSLIRIELFGQLYTALEEENIICL